MNPRGVAQSSPPGTPGTHSTPFADDSASRLAHWQKDAGSWSTVSEGLQTSNVASHVNLLPFTAGLLATADLCQTMKVVSDARVFSVSSSQIQRIDDWWAGDFTPSGSGDSGSDEPLGQPGQPILLEPQVEARVARRRRRAAAAPVARLSAHPLPNSEGTGAALGRARTDTSPCRRRRQRLLPQLPRVIIA